MLRCCIIAILLLRVIALAECGFNTSSRAFIAAMRSITNRVWPTFCRMPKYSSELVTRLRLHLPAPGTTTILFPISQNPQLFPDFPLGKVETGVANKRKMASKHPPSISRRRVERRETLLANFVHTNPYYVV